MEGLEGVEDPKRLARRRLGIRLGVLGMVLLFASAISLRFVPDAWQLVVLGLIATGAVVLVAALLLVR
ncbi:MAG: hypothetical protein LN410_01705 [Candidatus Thermoplasmatota archaeon]|nr:hypothetical protein [Candidatus Thermoplasmatota archaeon]